MNEQVMHDAQNRKFTLIQDGQEALLAYALRDDRVMEFTRTYVPEALRGGRIAAQLAAAGLQYAVANGYRIMPTCSYIRNYINKYRQYQQHLKDAAP